MDTHVTTVISQCRIVMIKIFDVKMKQGCVIGLKNCHGKGDRMKIKVNHPNGSVGILYGKSSMVIYDEYGHQVMRIRFRNIITEKEAYDFLEKLPEMRKEFLEKMDHALLYGKDGERE